MGEPLITQGELELHIGVGTVAKLACDDGSGTPSPAVIDKVIAGASDSARGILRPGFTDEQVTVLVGNDQAAKDLVLDLATGRLGQRRPGLLSPDGKTPYSGFRGRAEKALAAIADGKVRAAGEQEAGANRKLRTRVNIPRTKKPTFAATKDDPYGPGGY